MMYDSIFWKSMETIIGAGEYAPLKYYPEYFAAALRKAGAPDSEVRYVREFYRSQTAAEKEEELYNTSLEEMNERDKVIMKFAMFAVTNERIDQETISTFFSLHSGDIMSSVNDPFAAIGAVGEMALIKILPIISNAIKNYGLDDVEINKYALVDAINERLDPATIAAILDAFDWDEYEKSVDLEEFVNNYIGGVDREDKWYGSVYKFVRDLRDDFKGTMEKALDNPGGFIVATLTLGALGNLLELSDNDRAVIALMTLVAMRQSRRIMPEEFVAAAKNVGLGEKGTIPDQLYLEFTDASDDLAVIFNTLGLFG